MKNSDILAHESMSTPTATASSLPTDRKPVLNARILDVDTLDEYLIDLLWQPLVAVGKPFREIDVQQRNDGNFLLTFVDFVVHRLTRQERRILVLLITLFLTGTTPATRLLGLEWKQQQPPPPLRRYSHHASQLLLSISNQRNFLGFAAIKILSLLYHRYLLHLQALILHRRRQRALNYNAAYINRHNDSPSSFDSQQDVAARNPSSEFASPQALALHRQVWLCRVINRLTAIARLLVWVGAWTGLIDTPSLSMFVTGNALVENRCYSIMPPPRLHVNWAHRRWIWNEAVLAYRLLFAGVLLSPSTFRDVWRPWIDPCWENIMDMWFRLRSQWRRWWIHRSEVNRRQWQLLQSWRRRWRSSPYLSESSNTIIDESTMADGRTDGTQHTADYYMTCPLCGTQSPRIPVKTDCGHIYCYTCLYRASLSRGPRMLCRMCRSPITQAVRVRV